MTWEALVFNAASTIHDMKISICLTILLLMVNSPSFSQSSSEKVLNVSASGVAMDGYDPVSYFIDERPVEGKKEFSLVTHGVTYFFSSAKNREIFRTNPAKYEPEYGGWCAFAMGDSGEKVEVDPETYKIVDGKLYLFYNKFFNNTLTSWNKDEPNLKSKADKNWQRISSGHSTVK